MHDLRRLRENPEAFDAALARRGLEPQSGALVAMDEGRRAAQTALNELQARRNDLSRQVGQAKKEGRDAEPLMREVAALKAEMEAREAEVAEIGQRLDAALSTLPNLPLPSVPDGADETANVEVSRWGAPRNFAFQPREHDEIGQGLGLMDFETAGRISGSRFVILRGQIARLERALASFMLDLHTQEFGYTEINGPVLVREQALYGTGQLPKFAEEQFRTTGDHWLIPTAEVTLTNTVADTILEEAALPLRLCAFSLCFRAEAGAAGRDTRGMIRQHQFEKVELVSIVHPDKAAAELERMRDCAEAVLRRLEIPYRVMALCAGDMGFSAERTYDLEVWLPGQNRYREISSCSTCGEFQARRMGARFRPEGETKGTRFVHTLNGSGVAIGRCLVAVLENYQQEDGSVLIPAALRPYMGGLERIAAP